MDYTTLFNHAARNTEGMSAEALSWAHGVLNVVIHRQRDVQVRIAAPEVTETRALQLMGKQVRTCVLKTGAHTRRIVQAGIGSRIFNEAGAAGALKSESYDEILAAATLQARHLYDGSVSSYDFDVMADIETRSWVEMWWAACVRAYQGQQGLNLPIETLIQGHFDKVTSLVLEQKTVTGDHQIEVWSNSLVMNYPYGLVDAQANECKLYLACVAGILGYELAATPKSHPGSEFLHADYVRKMSFALGGFSVVDKRGLRELPSGLRGAQTILNAKGNEHLPSMWRERVTYLNTVVAEIPGVTSEYAGKRNTGGQMLLLGDAQLEVQMTRTHRLEDSVHGDIFEAGAKFGLSREAVTESMEVFQVGGGHSRSARYVEVLPNPQLVKLSIIPFGCKGMAPKTERRFAELRPDGYHLLDLCVAPDDVTSKKAGSMLIAMACEHAGVSPSPADTVADITPVLQSRLSYAGVPIFELTEGTDVITLHDGSVILGMMVPVLNDEGTQLVAATGSVPVLVMSEGDNYGVARRGGTGRKIALSPWATVPNLLPEPALDPLFPFMENLARIQPMDTSRPGGDEEFMDFGDLED